MTEPFLSIDLSAVEVITFDCYGTLIDWESGICGILRPIFEAHGTPLDDDEILKLYAKIEAGIEGRSTFRSYTNVLNEVMAEIGTSLGWEPESDEKGSLSGSLPDWPPFPDTVDALRILKQKFKLAVISNVDDDLFAGTSRRLGIPFDWIITAQQAGAYKPDLSVFEYALDVIGVPESRLLHVAQSLYHDIAPARKLDLMTVWVNRRSDKPGWGATPPSAARPHLEIPDLKTLVSHLGQI